MNEEFIKIYDDYKNDIFRLAMSYTKNRADSEDVVQNVFVKLFKNINKIDFEHIKGWLIKVTINECKTLLLSSWKKKIRPFSEKEENVSCISNSDTFLDEIWKLPKTNRLIIHLYYYENYSIKEIAEILKMTESNVKIKLYRSRKLLKNIILEDGYEK